MGNFLNSELAHAVRRNDTEQVKMLVETGANTGPENIALWTSLNFKTKDEIIKILVAGISGDILVGVNGVIRVRKEVFVRMLVTAIAKCNSEMFFEAHSRVLASMDRTERTAAFLAAAGTSHMYMMSRFMNGKADIFIKDAAGKDVLAYIKNEAVASAIGKEMKRQIKRKKKKKEKIMLSTEKQGVVVAATFTAAQRGLKSAATINLK